MIKRISSILLTIVLVAGAFVGCKTQAEKAEDKSGSSTAASVSEGEKSTERYVANIYLYGDGSQRMLDFLDNEFKERMENEINVTPNIQFLPWSEYGGGKSELMYSAGEKFSTNTDTTFLQKCVSKGYHADITAVSKEYAKNLYEYCGGEESFKAFQVDGKQYALPFGNKPNAGDGSTFVVRQDLLEGAGMQKITSIEDLEKFYEIMHTKDPSYIGYGRGINIDPFFSTLDTEINILRPSSFIMLDGNKAEDSTVYSFYASDEYRQICEITSRWVEKGIIPSYALSNREQLLSEFDNSRGLFAPGSSYRGFEYMNIVRRVDTNAIMQNYYLGDKAKFPLMSRGTYSTAFAFGANLEGEELEAYVKAIDVMQSSQDWNTFMLYGVEGKDYTINEDGTAEKLIQDSFFDTYLPDNINFNQYPSYVTKDMIDEYTNWNDGCIPMKTLGFAFNMESVNTEYAQIQAVEQEYLDPITYGFVDYESNITEALRRLEEAGIKTYVAEYEKQLAEFLKNK